MWAWHFELEVGIAGDCHEFGVTGSSEEGMVRTLEVYDFKGECLLAVVYQVTKMTDRVIVPRGITRHLGTIPWNGECEGHSLLASIFSLSNAPL